MGKLDHSVLAVPRLHELEWCTHPGFARQQRVSRHLAARAPALAVKGSGIAVRLLLLRPADHF